jgi:hypothetical protein
MSGVSFPEKCDDVLAMLDLLSRVRRRGSGGCFLSHESPTRRFFLGLYFNREGRFADSSFVWGVGMQAG